MICEEFVYSGVTVAPVGGLWQASPPISIAPSTSERSRGGLCCSISQSACAFLSAWKKLAESSQSGPQPRWMRYRVFCSSSCSGQGYKKMPVSADERTERTRVRCLSKIHALLSGHFGEKRSLFKKPEEAECAELRWRRVGGHPFAACRRNVYCPGISSRRRKVTAGDNGGRSPRRMKSDLSSAEILLAAVGFCFANKERRSPEEQPSVSQTQSWEHPLSGCLLLFRRWLFIYPETGAFRGASR